MFDHKNLLQTRFGIPVTVSLLGEIIKCGNSAVSNTLQNELEEKFQFQTTRILALKHQGERGPNVSSKFKPKKLQFFMKIKLKSFQKNHFWKYYT
jgi:hypothetical protein